MKSVVTFIIVLVGIYSCDAFKCYICATNTDADCFKNSDPGPGDDCEAGTVACSKITFVDQDLGNGKVLSGTARGCEKKLPDGFEDGDCKELTVDVVTANVTAEYCYCKSELCNSSGKFNNSIMIISILVFVSYLMK